MVLSQNGWGVQPPLDNRIVPGTNGVKLAPGIRAGDVADVIFYVASRFNLLVEQLVPGWNWGYAYRAIRGARTTSNHASGTAADFNAPKHVLGKRGTFTEDQRNILRAIQRDCRNLIRWGEFYETRVDGMHVEVVGNAADIARLAADIRAGRLPGGPDGTNGNNMPANAPVAAVVPAPVVKAGPTAPPPVIEKGCPAPGFPLRPNQYFGPKEPLSNANSVSGYFSHRDDLRVWQDRMKYRGWKITPDGYYGKETEDVARAFQRDKGMAADALIGPATWAAAWTADITR